MKLWLAFVALIVFFGLIRPTLKAALPQPPMPLVPGATLTALVDDPQDLPDLSAAPALPAPIRLEHLERAKALARDNPAAVAGIVRGWVNGEAAVPVGAKA